MISKKEILTLLCELEDNVDLITDKLNNIEKRLKKIEPKKVIKKKGE